MTQKKKLVLRYFVNVLTILLGTFLMGLAFSVFLSPNNISPTGFSGIASLISNFAARYGVNINPSILYLVMNAILFAIAFKSMGKEFILLSITGVLGYSLCMVVTELIKIDVGNDLLLCALYGGLFMGLGSGLVIRSGGSTGGGDTIACMLKNSNVKITTGQIIIAIDFVIIVCSCFAYGINYGMYALVTCFIMGNACDIVINGVKAARAFYIITDKGSELSEAIFKNVQRGVTELNVTGMYKHQNHQMLLCVVTRSQITALKRTIKSVDPKAFMYSVNVSEALGVGFEPLDKKTYTLKPKKNGDATNTENTNEVLVNETKTDETKQNLTEQKNNLQSGFINSNASVVNPSSKTTSKNTKTEKPKRKRKNVKDNIPANDNNETK